MTEYTFEQWQVNAIAGSEHSANSWHYQVNFERYQNEIMMNLVILNPTDI